MKHLTITALVAVILAAVTLTTSCIYQTVALEHQIRQGEYDAGHDDGWAVGFEAGIQHAIEDSIIWTVERYDPDDPESTARPDGMDQTIYLELDGELYEHGMYQG